MPDIIQFLHPGPEYYISKKTSTRYCWNNKFPDGMYFWNSGAHCRKFLRSNGDYVDKNNNFVQSEELLFWGEWEPCSHFQMLGNPANNPFLPHHIHSPKYCLKNQGGQNTDPLVFGSNFYYSICNQRGKLLKLSIGTIILFGTNYIKPKDNSNPCFVLDTVFIVGASTPYSVNGQISGLNQKPGDILYDITLSKLGNMSLNLYTGEKYSNNKNYYSFAPVKKYSQHSQSGFERAKFYHSEKEDNTYLEGLSKKTQGWSSIKKNVTHEECQSFWNSLVKKIRSQGFELGVRFDKPPAPEKNSCCCDENSGSQNQVQKAKKAGGC